MSKELVVNTDDQTTRIAIVENGDLAELFIETEEHERTIGNLFLGRIRRVMPSIQAAFVDIGQKQDAFLHFSDLNESIADWLEYVQQEKPEIAKFKSASTAKHKAGKRRRPISGRRTKRLEDGAEDPEAELAEEQATDDGERKSVVALAGRGRRRAGQRHGGRGGRRSNRSGRSHNDDEGDGVPPESFLKRDQPILVKISKEPIAQKGSRVTTDISLAGRFLVLVPMANYVAVSKKVSSFKERRRLRALAKMLLPDGFGVIVRTVAEGQNAKALDTDLRLLKDKWKTIEQRLGERPKPPAPVYEDVNMVSSIMRDLFSEDFDRILIDDHRAYRNIKGYVQAIAPDMGAKVQLHDKKTPVFRAVGIERSVSEAFESRVNLPSGGYLYIEQTEAMHVVDVNSGRAGRGLSQEDNSLKVNLEAAKVIARQIRLRDLGGILVIDFIDMRSERSRRKVYEQIRKEFRNDRAVTKVLPMSDFGLMQITRQRLRPSITHTFSDLHEESNFDDGAGETGAQEAPTRQRDQRPRPVDPLEATRRIEDWLEAFGAASWKGAVRLKVHPFTAAYLRRGLMSFGLRCLFKYRMRVVIEESPAIDPGRFRFYDETNGKEIRRPPRRGRKKSEKAAPAAEAKVEAGQNVEASQEAAETVETESRGRGRGSRSDSDGDSRGSGRSRGRGRRREEGDAGEESRTRGRGRRSDSEAESGDTERPKGRGKRTDGDSPEDTRSRGRGRRSDAESDSGDGRSRRDGRRSRDGDAADSDGRGRGRGQGRRNESPVEGGEEPAENAERRGRGRGPSPARVRDTSASAPEISDGVPETDDTASQKEEAPARRTETRKRPSRARGKGGRFTAANEGSDADDAPREETAAVAETAAKKGTPTKGDAADSNDDAAAGETRRASSRPAPETVQEKSKPVQPFKLRYSSSHTPQSETAQTDQA